VALQDQLRKLQIYSCATQEEMRRREKEVGLGAARTRASVEVYGSASPFFKVNGTELKRATVRYIGLPDAVADAVKVKDAFGAFVGPCKMYTGASVTKKALSCDFVCGELLPCAKSEHITVPAVLASMKQFTVEMRAGDEDMCRISRTWSSSRARPPPRCERIAAQTFL